MGRWLQPSSSPATADISSFTCSEAAPDSSPSGHHLELAAAPQAKEVVNLDRGGTRTMARRTRALVWDARAAREMAPRVASLMAEELSRDAAWQAGQVETFQALADQYLP